MKRVVLGLSLCFGLSHAVMAAPQCINGKKKTIGCTTIGKPCLRFTCINGKWVLDDEIDFADQDSDLVDELNAPAEGTPLPAAE